MDTATKWVLALGGLGLVGLGVTWYLTRPEPSTLLGDEGLAHGATPTSSTATPPTPIGQLPVSPAKAPTPLVQAQAPQGSKAATLGGGGVAAAAGLYALTGLRM
jgi:hypothetical protein